jgi:hypothetical protein
MLWLIAIWIVALATSASVGFLALGFLHAESIFPHPEDYFAAAVWIGLGLVASLALFAATFTAVTPWLALPCALLVPFARHAWYRMSAGLRRTKLLLAAGLCVMIAGFSLHAAAVQVDAYDTGLYHQQAVAWLATYGVVPGTAWLQPRLGWNSAWFALAGLFDHGPLQGRVSPILGGFVILLSLWHWLIKLQRVLSGQESPTDWLLLLVYPPFLLAAWAWHYDVSLGPDTATWILVVLTIWTAGMLLARPPQSPRAFCLPLLIGSVGCGFKFSLLPLIPSGVAFLLLATRGRRPWMAALLCLVPALVPVGVNTVATGCPLYPSPILCVPTPGAVTRSYAARIQSDTRDFNRWGGGRPKGAGNLDWLRSWTKQPEKLSLSLLAVIGTIALLVLWRKRHGWFIPWILVSGWLGVLFVFWGAPNPRFLLGYYLLLPAVAFMLSGIRFSFPRLAAWVPATLAVALTAGLLWHDAFRRAAPIAETLSSPLAPPAAIAGRTGDGIHVFNRYGDRRTTLETTTIRGTDFVFSVPVSSDQCWNVELPCTSALIDKTTRLRDPGKGLAGGFAGGFANSRFAEDKH